MKRAFAIAAASLLTAAIVHSAFGSAAPEVSPQTLHVSVHVSVVLPHMLWAAFFLPCFHSAASTCTSACLTVRS